MVDPAAAPAPAEDNFDALFAEAVAAAEAGTPPPATPPASDPPPVDPPAGDPPPPADDKGAAPPAEPPKDAPKPPVGDPPPAAPAAPPAGDPPPAAPAAPAPEAKAPDPAPAAPAAPEESPEAKAQREAFEASLKPYVPSDAENAAMEKFKKDFPDEYLGMETHFKMRERAVNAQVYQAIQAVMQHFTGMIQPVAETVNASEQERHFQALHAAHADYDTVIEKVPAWIDTQPAYLRAAMKEVYESGSTQDVIALVADFKKATGVAPAPAAAAPAAASAAPPPAAAPKAPPADAADLAPVGTKRVAAAPKAGGDPNDFDGAFKEAVAAMG